MKKYRRTSSKTKIKSLVILIIVLVIPMILNSSLLGLNNKNKGFNERGLDDELQIITASNNPPNAHYFTYYKDITIDNTKVSGTGSHTNFPMLISILDTDLRYNVQPDGDDIAFAYNTLWLNHEFELFNQEYNDTHAQLIAWVQIPDLSTSQDTIISMYYGNSTMSSQQNPNGVWDSYYEAVYHFHDDFLDSTVNNRQGINSGSVDIAGQIGDGQDFERSDNYDNINIGLWSVSGTKLTIQAWVRFESFSIWDARILSKNSGISDTEQDHVWMLGTSTAPNRLRGRIKTGTNNAYGTTTVIATSGDLTTNTWYLTTLIYDGSTIQFVLDGNPVGSFIKTGSLRINDWPITIGNSPTGARPIDGIIDEVRISSVVRSNSWLRTEYNNQDEPESFYSIGVEELVSPEPPNADYFNYYKTITVDHNLVSGTGSHLNFPLLISLLDEDLHDDVQPDGDDIAFSVNGKWLNHQIEVFNQTYSGNQAQLVAWVKIPFLSTVEDTNITMYYSNSTMDSRENPTEVWDTNYVGVWHLNEDPSGIAPQMKDSTINPSDGSSSGFMTASDQVSGMIGDALDFDGVDDHVDFSNPPELQITGEITFQAWFHATGTITQEYIICKTDGSGNRGWDISFDPNDATTAWIEFRYSSDGWNWQSIGYEQISLGNWYHAVAIYKPSEYAKFFLDGSIVGIDTTGVPPSQYDPPYNFRIAEKADGGDNFEGIIDEARVSNIARSDGWIITEYNNQYDPNAFYSVGLEQSAKPVASLEAEIHAIDLSNNLVPNVNISMYKDTELITSAITNSNGTVRFTNITQGAYDFTASITSNIAGITEIVNSTSQPILIDKGYQEIDLLCNIGMNFFSVLDVDGFPVESGWILVGNSSDILQNCTINTEGKTTFYWVRTMPYTYNYTVYYRNDNYLSSTITLDSDDITNPNDTIQVLTELTTVDFTILSIGEGEPVGGAKLKLKLGSPLGVSIVNLTTDLEGKATLRWLTSSELGGDYSLEIEFFGQNRDFNNTEGGGPDVSDIQFTVSSSESKEFRISITLENFQTELLSLNPADYIQAVWGSQIKIRCLFNVTKAVGLPGFLGPTYADSITYQLLLGGSLVYSGQIFNDEDYIGRHYGIIDTKQVDSDVTYIIKISAQKSGFTLPSDLILQLNILNNNLELNQSENDNSALSVYWLESANMSLNSYGVNSESFTVENAIYQNIDHEFSFSIPDIQTDWNLSGISFNIYNISWNTDVSNINITFEDPYGGFHMFHRNNHSGWDFDQGTWEGIYISLDIASPSNNNIFNFSIGGSFNNPVDIIAEAFFVRNTIHLQYSKFNITNSLSILTEIEGWAIKNITFEIFDCYETSTWTLASLSTLTNLNITTNEGFTYSLDYGNDNGNGTINIDDLIIYPLGSQFLFIIDGYTNLSFSTIIKVEYVQEFYKDPVTETFNKTITFQNVDHGGITQINASGNEWREDNANIWIKGINNGTSYFNPSDLAMSITIGGSTYTISDYSLGEGIFSLEGFTRDEIQTADINTNQPVNFSLFIIIDYSITVFYEITGIVNYIIREFPSIYGNVPYNNDLGYYLQSIDTSLIDSDEYTIRFTFTKDHYETKINDLKLIVENRLTLINGSSDFFRKIENIYVEDPVNFTFVYTDAILGTEITDLKTQYFIWERYDELGNVLESGQGTIVQTIENLYSLDFDTHTRAVGDYLLIVTLDKDNYDYKNAMILLTIKKRVINYTLSDNFNNYRVNVIQGKSVTIQLNLTDPTRENIPLINATVSLTISGTRYEFQQLANGTYQFIFPTSDINAFFSAQTLRVIINISKNNYITEQFSIIIVVEMPVLFFGIPTFYFLLMLSAIIVFTGSIVGYRVYKHAKIPTFVKKVRSMRKTIEDNKEISNSLLYRNKEVFIGEIVEEKWDSINLSLEKIFGIKLEKKISKAERIISEAVRRRDIRPIGLVFMKWDERIGTEILAKYPEETIISEKTLMQIYSTHEYSGEKGIVTLTAGSLNIISYYTGPEKAYYLLLVLNLDDDPDVYEGGMADILRILLENVENENYKRLISSLFQRLSLYPSLNDEEILALMYQDEIKQMIITNLRDVGVMTKSELVIWLRDKYIEGFVDIEATLLELLKKDIIKQISVKGFPSELIVLTNDIFMLRVPPSKLFADPINSGLPTQFAKEYLNAVKDFFQTYQPTAEDNLKIIEILINTEVYETLRLLRTAVVTRQELDKLRTKGVKDAYAALKLLWDNQMVKVFRDEKNNEYYALISDFYMDLIFPKYLLKVIKLAYEQKSIANKALIEYLKVLEDTYYSQKSKKKTKKEYN
ncbi:MAG: DUF2341 domain-containing protein [Promethearchaeota archaeon]